MQRVAFGLIRYVGLLLLIVLATMTPGAPAVHAAVDAPEVPVVTDVVREWGIGGGLLYWAIWCSGEDFNPPPSTVKRQPVGGGITRTLFATEVAKCRTHLNLAAADDGVYYYNDNVGEKRLERIRLSQPFTPQPLADIPVNEEPFGGTTLKVSGNFVYWVASSAGKILRVARSGGAIETVLDGLTQPSDVVVVGSILYWTEQSGVWSGVNNCATLPCNSSKVKLAPYGFANTAGSGLLYRTGNFQTFSLTWVERTNVSPGNTQDRIRRLSCNITEACNQVQPQNPGTIFQTADQNKAIGPPVSDGTNLWWTELKGPPGPDGQVRRKALTLGELNGADNIIVNQPGLDRRMVIANGNAYFAIVGASGTPLLSTGIYLVPLNAAPITQNLAADAWEITQGIQNTANGALVVEHKTTYVRVYGKQLDGPNANFVDAQLVGKRNGVALPGSPLKPLNGMRALRVGGTYDRARINDGWLFLLPGSWVAGTVELSAEVDPRQSYTDPDRTNNVISTLPTLTFQKQPPVCVWTVPVRTHTPKPSVYDPNFSAMVDGFFRRWPVPDVWIYRDTDPVEELQICTKYYIPYPCYGAYELEDGWGITNGPPDRDKVITSLWVRAQLSFNPDACDNIGAPVHFMGMVHPDANNGGASGYASLISKQSWVQLPPHFPNPLPPDWFKPRAASVMAQELGHNFGRKHVNCGSPDNIDSSYPYTPCQISNTDAGTNYYGFDVRTRTPIPPTSASDFMSYGSRNWVSDYTWEALIGKFPASAVTTAQSPLAAGDVVYIAGFVDTAINAGALTHGYMLPGATVPPQTLAAADAARAAQLEHGDEPLAGVTLRLLGPGDVLVHEEPVVLLPTDDHSPESDPAMFSTVFAAPAGAVTRVQLVTDTLVITELTPGLAVPQVAIQEPVGGAVIDANLTIRWTASDPDPGDELHFLVQYSYNNGQHWHTLIGDFPGSATGENVLSLADLGSLHGSNGQNAIVRVAASDGYHTAIATSQKFTVPNRKPDPYIFAPAAGESFPAAQPVVLSGTATDAEDGGLSEAALAWKVDGAAAGSGANLAVDGLAPGGHVATLTATDSLSATASVSATFQIDPLGIPQTAAPVLDGFCEDDAYAGGVDVRLAPYDADNQATVRLVRTGTDVWACFRDLKKGDDDPIAFAGLRVDVNNSRDALAQIDDVGFFAGEDGSVFTRVGDGAGGFDTDGPGGVQAQVSSDATTWRAELRIAAAALGGLDHLVGLKLGHYSVATAGADFGWPFAATNTAPNTWALTALGDLPRLTSLDPDSATVGGPQFTLVVTGSHFLSGTVVLWNGVPLATEFGDSEHLTATVGAERIAAAGLVTIKARSLAPANFESNGLPFVVLGPGPVVTGVSPASVKAGSPTLQLTINGSNFTQSAQVLWNGIALPTTFGNGGQLTAQVAAALITDGQTVGIAVQNTTPLPATSGPVALVVTPTSAVFLPTLNR